MIVYTVGPQGYDVTDATPYGVFSTLEAAQAFVDWESKPFGWQVRGEGEWVSVSTDPSSRDLDGAYLIVAMVVDEPNVEPAPQ